MILLGNNAQGKTNLLEAINLLATGKSATAHKDAELVRFGAPQAVIRSEVQRELTDVGIDMLIRSAGRRAVRINGVAQKRLADLFGKGYLAITFDQAATGERYQGIVPLEGGSLAEAAQHYFAQSEQIPSLVRLAVDDSGHVAGGLLVQHLPEGEEGRDRLHTRLDHPEWDHVRILAETIRDGELTDGALPLETLLWRLFHEEEEVRVLSEVGLSRGCRCNAEHIRSVLSRFSAEEREAMADADGMIGVDCEFCSRAFPVALGDLAD